MENHGYSMAVDMRTIGFDTTVWVKRQVDFDAGDDHYYDIGMCVMCVVWVIIVRLDYVLLHRLASLGLWVKKKKIVFFRNLFQFFFQSHKIIITYIAYI